MNQTVKAGAEFLRAGKQCYVGQLRQAHGKIEIHSDDGDIAILSPDAFRREVVDGEIQMLVQDGDGLLHPVSSDWMQREGKSARNARNRRTQLLTYVDSQLKRGLHLNQILDDLKTFCHANGLGAPPCERTLRNWRRLAKGHQSMLSPAWNRCGNRHQGPDEILLGCIKAVIDATVIGSDRFTLSATWGTIEALFDEQWRKKMGDAPLPRHSIRKLKQFIRSMPWGDTLKLRLDGRTARAITRTAVYRNTTHVLWEVVEMDATVLDISVRDDANNDIGRPVLYVAIDVATGYIVGLYLTIQKPSTLPFVECLRFMYFPKEDGFDARYGIKNRIEVFGKPVLLHVDNGSEFIGMTATELVRQLFGDTARCQPYKPEEKPHVERFNGTLRAYILTLAGATTSSITGEKRVPPKNEKLLTLEQLRGKIYRFVYDRYALQVNELRSMRSGKPVAPMDIVRQMKATFTEPVPVSREEFENSLCFKRDSRSLGHDGITFDGWKYHSDDLAYLYKKSGGGSYEFLYSDLDATTIYVKPPGGGERIAAFEKDLEGSGVDRATAKKIRLQIRAAGKELNRRTFEHKRAEFRELQQSTKGTRSRAKTARINDILNAAEEHQRRTMPLKSPVPEVPDQHGNFNDSSDFISLIPRGRMMRAKR